MYLSKAVFSLKITFKKLYLLRPNILKRKANLFYIFEANTVKFHKLFWFFSLFIIVTFFVVKFYVALNLILSGKILKDYLHIVINVCSYSVLKFKVNMCINFNWKCIIFQYDFCAYS